nr:hypothetical protein [Mycoplasmopsis bovis]
MLKLETSWYLSFTDLQIAKFWHDPRKQPKLSNGSRALKELGIVTKVGPNCTKIKVGDRVGVGYM